MNKFLCIAPFFFLGFHVFNLPLSANVARRVRIVVDVKGETFSEELPWSEQAKLRRDLQSYLQRWTAKIFPCMEWEAGKDSKSANVGAELLVDIVEEPYHHSSFFWLNFRGVFEGEPPKDLWKGWPIGASVEIFAGDLESMEKKIFGAIDKRFNQIEEIIQFFNATFINHVPIADKVSMNQSGNRFIIPVETGKIKLDDGSPMRLDLLASLCYSELENCIIDIKSQRGSSDRSFLLGRFDENKHNCCENPDWSRIDSATRIRVFLGEEHRHCFYVPSLCLSETRLFRHPGGP